MPPIHAVYVQCAAHVVYFLLFFSVVHVCNGKKSRGGKIGLGVVFSVVHVCNERKSRGGIKL